MRECLSLKSLKKKLLFKTVICTTYFNENFLRRIDRINISISNFIFVEWSKPARNFILDTQNFIKHVTMPYAIRYILARSRQSYYHITNNHTTHILSAYISRVSKLISMSPTPIASSILLLDTTPDVFSHTILRYKQIIIIL